MKNSYQIGDIVMGNWTLARLLGAGSFGNVFEAERVDFGVVYRSAIKIITIPQDQSEVRNARTEGMDEASVTSYFYGIVEDQVKEIELMSKLKGTAYIVSYEDHVVLEHKGEFGWDILIRMELLTPLTDWIDQHPMTPEDVVKLGIDICHGLELCQKFHIIHRDIKPGNIFVSEFGDFKLGDFGIARIAERTSGNLSYKGTYNYMAPEVYLKKKYGFNADLYSLGLVLYWLLNDNRLPFLPTYPNPITYNNREVAMARRMRGETFPAPRRANGHLAGIVLKATSFYPENRYSSAAMMRQELESCFSNRRSMGENAVRQEVIVPERSTLKDDKDVRKIERTMLIWEDDITVKPGYSGTEPEPDVEQDEEKIGEVNEKPIEEAKEVVEVKEDGNEKDYQKAVEYYQKAAALGNAMALNNLGMCYEHGYGVTQDYEKAKEYYEKAIAAGESVKAPLNLVRVKSIGQINSKPASKYRTIAAIGAAAILIVAGAGLYQRQQNANSEVAVMVENASDKEKAFQKLLKKADSEDLEAIMLVADYYYNGKEWDGFSVTADKGKAVKYWSKAADLGDAEAMVNIGECYYDGLEGEPDYEKAVEYYRKAVDLGDARAKYNLGVCYANGNGVKQDYRIAVECYKKAADLGNVKASIMAGLYYEFGIGVTQSYERAVKYYKKAADLGDAQALVSCLHYN